MVRYVEITAAHAVQLSHADTVRRVCPFCQQRYEYSALIVGSGEAKETACATEGKAAAVGGKVQGRVQLKAELGARAALGESETQTHYGTEARESRGVLCPNCHRFSPRCVERWFPQGEAAALRQWLYQDRNRRVGISSLATAVVCVVIGLAAATIVGPLGATLICVAAVTAGALVACQLWRRAVALIRLAATLDEAQTHRWLCGLLADRRRDRPPKVPQSAP